MASVTVYFSGHEQGTYQLDKPMMVVGRESSCQIYLDNRSISRQHCAFIFKDNDFLLQDLNSANGTYINGQRITEKPLKHGDEIVIGNYELRYHSASSVQMPQVAAPVVDASANTLDENAFKNAAAIATATGPAPKPAPARPAAAPAESGAAEWFYAENNRQAGPVDLGTLKRLVRANVVNKNTLIWKEGMANWTAASEVPGVIVAEPPPIPAAQTQPPALPAAPIAPPVPAPAPKPAPQPKAVPEDLLRTLPLGSPSARAFSEPGPPLPFDNKVFANLGRYLLVWGLALLVTACWQAWTIVRLGPLIGYQLIFFLYVLIVLVAMVCAILSLFAGASFTGLSKLPSPDIPSLTQALGAMEKVCLAQCVMALLFLALLLIPSFMTG